MTQIQIHQSSSGLTDLNSPDVYNSLSIGSLSCLIQQVFNDCILIIEPKTRYESDLNDVKSICISNNCTTLTTYLIVILQCISALKIFNASFIKFTVLKKKDKSHLPISQATIGRLSFSWLKAQYFHLAIISAFLSTWKEVDIQGNITNTDSLLITGSKGLMFAGELC